MAIAHLQILGIMLRRLAPVNALDVGSTDVESPELNGYEAAAWICAWQAGEPLPRGVG
jgi:hypothetical protein